MNEPVEVEGSDISVIMPYTGWTAYGSRPGMFEGMTLFLSWGGADSVRLPIHMVDKILKEYLSTRKLVCRKAPRKTAVHLYVKEIIPK